MKKRKTKYFENRIEHQNSLQGLLDTNEKQHTKNLSLFFLRIVVETGFEMLPKLPFSVYKSFFCISI